MKQEKIKQTDDKFNDIKKNIIKSQDKYIKYLENELFEQYIGSWVKESPSSCNSFCKRKNIYNSLPEKIYQNYDNPPDLGEYNISIHHTKKVGYESYIITLDTDPHSDGPGGCGMGCNKYIVYNFKFPSVNNKISINEILYCITHKN